MAAITTNFQSLPAAGSMLIVEITEKRRITDQCRAMEVVARLASMGVQISIDDFGAGYSSLTYLKKLPISEIKIDKSFVLDMDDEESDIAIVKAIIQLARSLPLRVVAVGVETEESMAMLKNSGCTSLQGYWVSKPLPASRFEDWHEDWSNRVNQVRQRVDPGFAIFSEAWFE